MNFLRIDTKHYFVIVLAICSSATFASDKGKSCDEAKNTYELNSCTAIELGNAEEELTEYLAASLKHNADDLALTEALKTAQKDWRAYMLSHCDSVYTQWRDGTIKDVKSMRCKTKLTKQRTHDLWLNFLTYLDRTPPVLPDPNSL